MATPTQPGHFIPSSVAADLSRASAENLRAGNAQPTTNTAQPFGAGTPGTQLTALQLSTSIQQQQQQLAAMLQPPSTTATQGQAQGQAATTATTGGQPQVAQQPRRIQSLEDAAKLLETLTDSDAKEQIAEYLLAQSEAQQTLISKSVETDRVVDQTHDYMRELVGNFVSKEDKAKIPSERFANANELAVGMFPYLKAASENCKTLTLAATANVAIDAAMVGSAAATRGGIATTNAAATLNAALNTDMASIIASQRNLAVRDLQSTSTVNPYGVPTSMAPPATQQPQSAMQRLKTAASKHQSYPSLMISGSSPMVPTQRYSALSAQQGSSSAMSSSGMGSSGGGQYTASGNIGVGSDFNSSSVEGRGTKRHRSIADYVNQNTGDYEKSSGQSLLSAPGAMGMAQDFMSKRLRSPIQVGLTEHQL